MRLGINWTYEGEVDKDGRACGNGVAKTNGGSYKGTFLNDAFEG